MTNLKEFISESCGNPEFQFELMQLPYGGKRSAWTAFVQHVANLLGIKDTNALTEALQLGEKLAEMAPKRLRFSSPQSSQVMADNAI